VARRLDQDRLLPFLRWAAAGANVFSLLSEIQAASQAISGIVGGVRSYTQLDRGPVQTVDLAESISSTLAILKGRIGPGITLFTAIPSTLPSIEARGGELGQVWTNIIHNALDAMGEGGTLSVEAREEGGSVVVSITDTGHGIPEEVRSRIFDPFFTTKSEGQGTGLGLAIAHGIVVKQHRGTIEVESSPGHTTFQVWLPLRPLTALP
jgi:signal transduction histidine kinase